MHFRLAPEIKERVTRAAAITGQGLTDFAVSALSERAEEILERHETVLLNRKDYHFFLTSFQRRGYGEMLLIDAQARVDEILRYRLSPGAAPVADRFEMRGEPGWPRP